MPETIDFKPSDTFSSRLSERMVESPAIMMPREPKLAKPHMAQIMIGRERARSVA